MTMPPKDYIAARRRELRQQLQAINSELGVLDRMESQIPGAQLRLDEGAGSQAPPPEAPTAHFGGGLRRLRPGYTIKDLALEALAERGRIQAADILSFVKAEYGVDIDRTSLSPQLSRLKRDTAVTLDHSHWTITQKGRDLLAQKK